MQSYAVPDEWPNRDPIGERGGLNLYAFVDNTPINQVDVDGRWIWVIPVVIIGYGGEETARKFGEAAYAGSALNDAVEAYLR